MANKQKKRKRNAEKDFAKVKLKIGKQLKKPTATQTQFQTKKVVLLEQLSRPESECVSHRGLSLDDLCRQLGHYNTNVRKDAIVGARQLLSGNPELISSHLRVLIPSIGRLIADEKSDSLAHSQLRALLNLLCTSSSSRTMSSYFSLFMAHTLRALTHLKLSVRVFATSVLIILMNTYPDLCANSDDLFHTFLQFISGNRKPSNKQLLIDALKAFLNVFSADEAPKREGPLHSATFSIKLARVTPVDLTPPPHLFGFSDGLSSNVNRLKITSPERVLEALSAICPFLVALITDEKRQYINDALEITSKLTNTVIRVRRGTLPSDFESSLRKIVDPLLVLARKDNIPSKLTHHIKLLTTSTQTQH